MSQERAARLDSERFWEICEKAAHIFAQKGFDRTSLDDVSAALKITKPGLYYYFSSKDQLLYTIIEHYWERLYDGFKRKLKETDDPLEILTLPSPTTSTSSSRTAKRACLSRRSTRFAQTTAAATKRRRKSTRTLCATRSSRYSARGLHGRTSTQRWRPTACFR